MDVFKQILHVSYLEVALSGVTEYFTFKLLWWFFVEEAEIIIIYDIY